MSNNRLPSVTFAEFSSLKFVPRDKKSIESKKWYHRSFRKETIQDAVRLSQEIDNTQAGDITPDQLCRCTGIEVLFTKGLYRHVSEMRRRHVHAVLEEQRRQKLLGIQDMEKIAPGGWPLVYNVR